MIYIIGYPKYQSLSKLHEHITYHAGHVINVCYHFRKTINIQSDKVFVLQDRASLNHYNVVNGMQRMDWYIKVHIKPDTDLQTLCQTLSSTFLKHYTLEYVHETPCLTIITLLAKLNKLQSDINQKLQNIDVLKQVCLRLS